MPYMERYFGGCGKIGKELNSIINNGYAVYLIAHKLVAKSLRTVIW